MRLRGHWVSTLCQFSVNLRAQATLKGRYFCSCSVFLFFGYAETSAPPLHCVFNNVIGTAFLAHGPSLDYPHVLLFYSPVTNAEFSCVRTRVQLGPTHQSQCAKREACVSAAFLAFRTVHSFAKSVSLLPSRFDVEKQFPLQGPTKQLRACLASTRKSF